MDKKKKWFDGIKGILIKVEQELVGQPGSAKRDTAIKLINNLVDIPLIPEFVEEKIIGLLVDFAIDMFNTYLGKDWIDRV